MTTHPFWRAVRLLAVLALSASACGSSSDEALGGNGAFDSLTLASTGGLPWPPGMSSECNASYNNTVTVEAASATIRWDTCASDLNLGHTRVSQGSRTLTTQEMTAIQQALAEVQVGNHGYCGADKPTVTLDVSVGGVVGHYVEDFYGCNPPPDGRTFVENTSNLEYTLWNLVERPAITP